MAQHASEAAVLLHNLRSAHNVGAIFRTAEAAGVSKIYLTGYTSIPIDRFGRKRKDIAKVALGAEELLPWEYVKNPQALIRRLRAEGFRIVAVEQAVDAVDYRALKPKFPAAFLFGNEVRGLSPSLLRSVDVIAEIPLRGKKESLNVSVAAGVFLFRTLGRS